MIELLTPGVIAQLTGVAKGAAALGIWDMITGALPNNRVTRLSTIFRAINFSLRKGSTILTGIANMLEGIQGYGDRPNKL